MGKSVNKVMLLGNIGRDPEVKSTPSGMTISTFSLATTHRAKDSDGNWQDQTEWHNIKAFGKTAEIVRDYVHKGDRLFVEGRLTTNSWDDKKSGEKKYRTEIVIDDLSLLGGKTQNDAPKAKAAEFEADSSDIPF